MVKKTKNINFRISAALHDKIRQAARSQDLTESEYLRGIFGSMMEEHGHQLDVQRQILQRLKSIDKRIERIEKLGSRKGKESK